MKAKKCSKCGQEKEIGLFYKNKSTKDGYSYWCKECSKPPRKNKVKPEEVKCKVCGEVKVYNQKIFPKSNTNKFGMAYTCRDCRNEKKRADYCPEKRSENYLDQKVKKLLKKIFGGERNEQLQQQQQ